MSWSRPHPGHRAAVFGPLGGRSADREGKAFAHTTDPGSVLHQAVGQVNLLMMAVDSGGERFVCAGPVLSHYELEVIGAPHRISDAEWSTSEWPVAPELLEGLEPPPWTRAYLAR